MAQKGHHSFYKEQQKSILGQEKWTAKRIGKLLFKLLKWFLWGFLIVATLWGCVNEFIIQTSKNLGQGVEFYQGNDFVYPNTYQAYNITGYTSSKEAVSEGLVKADDGVTDKETTTPFNFVIANPDYHSDSEGAISSDQLFVNAIQYAKDNGDVDGIYYNLNEFTFLIGTGALGHDAATMTSADGEWLLPVSTLPSKLKEEVNEDINSASLGDESYTVSTIGQFYYYLLDKDNDGVVNNVINVDSIESDNINWRKDEDGEIESQKASDVLGLNGTLTPVSTSTTSTTLADWQVVENLETSYITQEQADASESLDDSDVSSNEEIEIAIQNEIKSNTNKMAFYSGTGGKIIVDEETGETRPYSSADLLAIDGVQEAYDKEISEATNGEIKTITVPDYEVNYNESFLNTGGTIYGGSQSIITSIKKGFPVRISEESQNLIETGNVDGSGSSEAWREENFNEWDTDLSQNQYGFDVENQMYGWTVLDARTTDDQYKADVMRVYNSAEDAANADGTLNDLEGADGEENAMYADQRRLGWGIMQENGESATETEYSVFDEKIKSWMNDEKYVSMNTSFTIGDEVVDVQYGTKFAGIESINQALWGYSSTNPRDSIQNYYGTTPCMYGVAKDGETFYEEGSILSDSASAVGQDSWGESRITFIGLKDWGKAWDVQYGPLYGAFVFPLAQAAMFVGEIFNYITSAWGVIFSIIAIVFLTRGLGALLSFKGTSNQMKMQEVQTDVAKIKAKYAKYDLKAEPRMKQKQQMEIMALYRKKEINPMGSLGTIFITMPIFISLWIIISSLPAYKVVFMGNFSWAVSSWYGVFNGGWLFILYLLVGISVGLVQGISSKLPTWLSNKRKGIKRVDDATKEAQKKQNKTQNIMIGVFVFMGLTVPALFAFYWISSGFFTIVLELCKHAYKVNVAKKTAMQNAGKGKFETAKN